MDCEEDILFEEDENEDNRNGSSAGLGLGIAAGIVTIGIGVGTALYYFFNKRQPTASEYPESFQTFRQRSWTLEQCSICIEVILKEQSITTLACTHRFHTSCVLPWLQQSKICPNCRKPN